MKERDGVATVVYCGKLWKTKKKKRMICEPEMSSGVGYVWGTYYHPTTPVLRQYL